MVLAKTLTFLGARASDYERKETPTFETTPRDLHKDLLMSYHSTSFDEMLSNLSFTTERMPFEDIDLVLVSRLGQDQDRHFFIVWILFTTWLLVRVRFSLTEASGSTKCEISSQGAKPLSGPDLVFTTCLYS